MSTATEERSQGGLSGWLWVVLIAGCLISLIGFGLRASFGLFTEPLSAAHGWGREVFAFAVAIQNLFWGLGQPLAGVIVDRYGPARVLAVGGVMYAAGMVWMAYADTGLTMTLSAGVLVGLALSGASTFTIVSAFARFVPEERRSWALGLGTAAGSLGQFLIAPLGQAFILAYGWQTALVLLGSLALLVPFLAIAMRERGRTKAAAAPAQAAADFDAAGAVRRAFGHRSYVLLVMGFFTCGFQLAFITVHLPPYLGDVGIGPGLAAWAIAVIGLFNVVGAYSSGILGGWYPKRYLLASIYLGRAVAIAAFVLVPPSTGSVLLFAAVIGVLWLSTVPPTSGLVVVMFGTRYVATLYGLVFLSHQIGSFIGVWLGGILYERTGNYDVVWWLCVILGAVAALLHLPIVERPADEPALATTR